VFSGKKGLLVAAKAKFFEVFRTKKIVSISATATGCCATLTTRSGKILVSADYQWTQPGGDGGMTPAATEGCFCVKTDISEVAGPNKCVHFEYSLPASFSTNSTELLALTLAPFRSSSFTNTTLRSLHFDLLSSLATAAWRPPISSTPHPSPSLYSSIAMNIDTSDNTTNEPFPKDHATASNNMVGLPATAKANKEPGASSAKAVGTNTTPNENQATTDDSQSAMERGGIDGSINDEDHHNKSIIVTNDEHKNDPEDRDGAVIDDTTSSQKEPIMSATQTLRTLWKVVHNDHQHTDGNSSNLHPSILQAVHDTVSVLLQAYDAILQPAVRAMMELERVQKELQATKRALQGKNREMERLKESEQQSKRAIAVRVCVCHLVSSFFRFDNVSHYPFFSFPFFRTC
jgi:hypothetical protein